MPPSALGDFLRRPGVVDNDAELCVIYNNYNQTPMFLETVCPTHKNTKRTHIDDIITSDYVWSDDVIIVYIFYRSLSRQRCGGPRCLASGPWLSAAPRGQRSTHGLTNASKTTWSSSLRVWSAPVAHTTPPAWPSKNCMYCMVYTGLYCIYVYFLKNIEFFGIFCLFFGCFQIRCLVSFCFSAFHFLVNTTTLLQTLWGEMCSTPSGLTSPQVSPHINTDLE